MKIYLIGLPYSGKTAVGKLLAEKLNYHFFDMNDEISKDSLMFIEDIVEHYGYKAVENVEKKLLEEVKTKDNLVIATNSNMVSNNRLKRSLDGLVIYLDVSNKTLEKRRENSHPSYLLADITIEEYANKLFLNYQNFADYLVDNNKEINNTIDEIIKIISKVENI